MAASRPAVEEGDIPEYAAKVLDLVDRIPAGFVLGYGDVAEMLGEGGPRQVGAVMSRFGHLTQWHRVFYGNGRFPYQRDADFMELLIPEGVSFLAPTSHGHALVDMARHRWDGGLV